MLAPFGQTRTISSLPSASTPTCTAFTSALSIVATCSSATSRETDLAVAEVEAVQPLLRFALTASIASSASSIVAVNS